MKRGYWIAIALGVLVLGLFGVRRILQNNPTPPVVVTPPTDPSGLTATSSVLVSGQIDLAWTDNSSDETAFSIEQSLDGATGWAEVATPAANAVSASITGLSNNTTYYFRIRANKSGTYSGYSASANAKTTAETVAPLTGVYHATEDGAGGIVYDSVDYARDVADRDLNGDTAFRAYEWIPATTTKDFSVAFDSASGAGGNTWDSNPIEVQFDNGNYYVKESGVQKATGTFLTTDVFRLIKSDGVFYVSKNGAVVWTSGLTPGASHRWLKICMHDDPAAGNLTSTGVMISQN